MRLKWSQAAIRDLQEIRGFIAQERPMAAQRVAQRILQVVRNLEHLLADQRAASRSRK
jgi:plasmid stabilization system protein ParE